jgi:hypothetical protein
MQAAANRAGETTRFSRFAKMRYAPSDQLRADATKNRLLASRAGEE